MLTISIADSLQGPAALSEWGYPDADVAAIDAWQQDLSTAAKWGPEDSSGNPWRSWLTDSSLQGWPSSADMATVAAAEEAAEAAAMSFALAAATMASCQAGQAKSVAAKKGPIKGAFPNNDAAFASPLRVPLPEPLALPEPLSNYELEPEFELLEESNENVFSEPQKISAPVGLRTHSGPGSLLTEAYPPTAATVFAPLLKPLVLAAATQPAPAGMTIRAGEVAGRGCTCVDWKIDDFRGKLQASMGRPVVSPAFTASGLSNLRLMVFPDARDAVKNARSHERKGLYSAMVKKGPLYGSLKLKADGLERPTVMTFALVVGGVRAGPSTYDFSEQAVLGLDDFGIDWLQQIEKSSGAISVSIEIIEVRQK